MNDAEDKETDLEWFLSSYTRDMVINCYETAVDKMLRCLYLSQEHSKILLHHISMCIVLDQVFKIYIFYCVWHFWLLMDSRFIITHTHFWWKMIFFVSFFYSNFHKHMLNQSVDDFHSYNALCLGNLLQPSEICGLLL